MNSEFEIFISFKATDNGIVTRDAQVASELYHTLTQRGFRVFFSSETLLKGKSGDFSKEIDSALDDARLLIVVSSNTEYITSRWVEYEWKTFNADILSNLKSRGEIITFTDDLDPRELPRVLRYVQNYNYSDKEKLLTFVHNFFDRVPLPERIKKQESTVEVAPKAVLSSSDHNVFNSAGIGELEIFRLRERRNYAIDMQAINYVKSQMNRKKYNVLVLGCAYGFVAETRFGLDDDIENVICIDKNEEVLEKAREIYKNYPHMKFYRVEIQSDTYVSTICGIMAELGISEIDIVFAADIFRYLNNAQTPLRNTRKLLRNGGFLLCKGCDDSKKMAYPDKDNLLQSVLDSCSSLHGMPNYYIGKELPLMILNAGFEIRGIKIDLLTTLSMSFEEKEKFFLGTVVRRKNIANHILIRDPSTKAEVDRLIGYIDSFEEIFYNTSFWYSESNLLFIAQKN
jgi:SAM-dependent methyltransferase